MHITRKLANEIICESHAFRMHVLDLVYKDDLVDKLIRLVKDSAGNKIEAIKAVRNFVADNPKIIDVLGVEIYGGGNSASLSWSKKFVEKHI